MRRAGEWIAALLLMGLWCGVWAWATLLAMEALSRP
jgi:hypothetical protein